MNNLFPWVWQGYTDGRKHYRGPLGMALLNGVNLGIYTIIAAVVWHFASRV